MHMIIKKCENFVEKFKLAPCWGSKRGVHTVKYKAQLKCCARLTYGEGALGGFGVERGEFKCIIYYRCDLYFTHRTCSP